MGATSNYRRSFGGNYPYAARYIAAAGLTNPTLIGAVKWLVNRLLSKGWLHPVSPSLSKIKALWPILGGTADSHRYNLVNTDRYALTYSATGITHSATGMRFDGISGFADTHLSLPEVADDNNVGIGAYLRDDQSNRGGYGVDIGIISGRIYTSIVVNASGAAYYGAATKELRATRTAPTTKGLWIAQHTSQAAELWYNNTLLASGLDQTELRVEPIGLGACYYNGGAPDLYAKNEHAAAFAIESFTPQEMMDYTDIIQTFQTMVGRQV